MLSPNLLKFQNSLVGEGVGNQLPTFDAEFKSLYGGRGGGVGNQLSTFDGGPNLIKSQIPYTVGEGGGDQLPTFDVESKSAKFLNSLYGSGRGVGDQLPKSTSNFQNLSPNLKFLFPWREGEHQLLVLTSCENLG